jgi:type VI secretion system protein ImpM
MSGELAIGYFGKLPCSGDFISRHIPRPLADALDQWLRGGLAELRAALPDQWRETYGAASVWNCAIPACVADGTTLIGLIAPSRDRVGREFPMCAGIALPPGASAVQLLADAHRWLRALALIVVDARDRPVRLDAFGASIQAIQLPSSSAVPSMAGSGDIFGVLGVGQVDVPTVPMALAHALPWPELPMTFDAGARTSFWWTSDAGGRPVRGFTTDVGLAPSLFVTLMQPLAPDGGNPS